jgi:hypothetical protein
MGIKLHAAFLKAGLPAPSMREQSFVGGGVNATDVIELVASLVHTILPDILRLGVATATEVGAETLTERLREEVIANQSVLVTYSQFGAWCRL